MSHRCRHWFTHAVLILLCVLFLLNTFTHAFAADAIQYEDHIVGISDPLLENVKSRFRLQQNTDSKNITPTLAKAWFSDGPQHIRLALQPFGYFNPVIHDELQQHDGRWVAMYWVDPGPITTISDITLTITGEGKDSARVKKLLANLPIHIGDPMIYKNYARLKDRLFEVSNNGGYLQAKLLESKILVNTHTNHAIVVIQFDTGPCFFVGPIQFDQKGYSEAFLRRFLPFQTGSPFSANQLLRTQQNMVNSNFFQKIEISADTENPTDRKIPVTVKVTPPKSRQYLFGLGYGTDTRVRATLGVNFRHVTETGQQFKALVQASEVARSAQAIYSIPGMNPLTDQYALIGAIENNQPQNYNIISKKFGVNYITKQTDWQKTFSITAQHDNDNFGKYDFVYPGITYLRIDTDNPLKTTNGYKINFNTSVGWMRSARSFIQSRLDGKYIHTYGDNLRLVTRGSAGILAIKNIDSAPLSLQYFSGGADSVRGYGYQDLGPGNKLLLGSVEVQQRLYHNWYAGLFYDMGNATRSFSSTDDYKHSVGVGIIFMSTIGPIEVTVARPLNDPINHKMRFQLSMGPDL